MTGPLSAGSVRLDGPPLWASTSHRDSPRRALYRKARRSSEWIAGAACLPCFRLARGSPHQGVCCANWRARRAGDKIWGTKVRLISPCDRGLGYEARRRMDRDESGRRRNRAGRNHGESMRAGGYAVRAVWVSRRAGLRVLVWGKMSHPLQVYQEAAYRILGPRCGKARGPTNGRPRPGRSSGSNPRLGRNAEGPLQTWNGVPTQRRHPRSSGPSNRRPRKRSATGASAALAVASSSARPISPVPELSCRRDLFRGP